LFVFGVYTKYQYTAHDNAAEGLNVKPGSVRPIYVASFIAEHALHAGLEKN